LKSRGELREKDLPFTFHAVRADDTQAITANETEAILWDLKSQKPASRFLAHTGLIVAVAFDGPNPIVVTNERGSGRLRVWSLTDRTCLRDLADFRGGVSLCRMSADGKLAFTAAHDGASFIWDIARGIVVRRIEESRPREVPLESPRYVNCVFATAFSHDGKRVATLHGGVTWVTRQGKYQSISFQEAGGQIAVWNLETRRLDFVLPTISQGQAALGLTFTLDDRKLVTVGSGEDQVVIWDLTSAARTQSKRLHRFDEQCEDAECASDGTLLTSGGGTKSSGSVLLCEPGSGSVLKTIDYFRPIKNVALSADGQYLLAADTGDRVHLTNAQTPYDHISTLESTGDVLEFAPDGKSFFAANGYVGSVWATKNVQKLATFDLGNVDYPRSCCAAFSPKGELLLVGGGGSFGRGDLAGRFCAELRLLNPANGSLVAELQGASTIDRADMRGHLYNITAVAFAGQQPLVASGAANGEIIVWHRPERRILRRFVGHNGSVGSLKFAPGDRYLLSVASDSTARMWDVTTGEEHLRSMSFEQGTQWAAVTPYGLFDGSIRGRETVYFTRVVEGTLTSSPMERFFAALYRTGLTARLRTGERPVPRDIRGNLHRPPSLRVVKHSMSENSEKHITFKVDIDDHGGGAQVPQLFRGDSPGAYPANGVTTQLSPQTTRWSFQLPKVPGRDRIEVRCARQDGLWASEPVVSLFSDGLAPPGKGTLHLLSVGVVLPSDRFDLADKSAAGIVDLFTRFAAPSFGRTSFRQLSSAPAADGVPTRARFMEELQAVGTSSSFDDTLVIYICGHGSYEGQRYYFLPAQSGSSSVAERLYVDEIADLVGKIPCAKRLVILDTCFAGEATRLDELFAFRGAIAKAERSTGVFTLAAVSDSLSWGVPELQMTHLAVGLRAVVLGQTQSDPVSMDFESAKQGQTLGVLEWGELAARNVARIDDRFKLRFKHDVVLGGSGATFPLLVRRDK